MKKVLLVLVLLTMVATPAMAFDLGGYMGPIKFKFSDYSDGAIYTSSSNGYGNADKVGDAYGVFKVSSIHADNSANTMLWWDGKDGEELTGEYFGIDDDFWSVSGTVLNVQSVSGFINVYLDSALNYDAGTGPGSAVGYNDGALFLSTAMVPGIKFGNLNPIDDHITYDNNLDFSTLRLTGDGAFYLDVTGGAYAGMFNSNAIGLTDDSGNVYYRDFSGAFDVDIVGLDQYGRPIPGLWLTESEDPIKGRVIPEPASMILMGIGLFGAARLRRKA